jgi:hypothetical protein
MLSDRAIQAAADQFRLARAAPPDPSAAAATPALDVLLDASLSMTSGDGSKEQLARALGLLLLRLCQVAGVRGSLTMLRGARSRAVDGSEADRIAQIPFDGAMPLSQLVAGVAPAPNAWRVFVSDLLEPGDPAAWLTPLADAARLWLIQVLDPWELQPQPVARLRLRDAESDEVLTVCVDDAAIAAYRARLDTHQSALRAACTAVGGILMTIPSAAGLAAVCREQLVPAGLLTAISAVEPLA